MDTVYEIKMTWEKFVEFERWDEFPERSDNPPYTAEVSFRHKNQMYFLDGVTDQETHRMDFIWYNVIRKDNKIVDLVEFARFDNFLTAVETPLFDGKSFRERIEEFEFAY